MKKIFVLGVILLFIGIAVAPSINQSVVTASQEDDLVEVTTQACGIQGYGNTTVKLTRQQYQDLEQYLVEFRVRLNQTSTRDEAVPIFKEAVVELNKYGLLPKGMNVEKAIDLVTGRHLFQNHIDTLSKRLENQLKIYNDTEQNLLCLVFGKTENTWLRNPLWELGKIIGMFTLLLLSPLYVIFAGIVLLLLMFPELAVLFSPIIVPLVTIGFFITVVLGVTNELITVNPFRFLSTIDFGVDDLPASGFLYTLGMLGIKNWNGSFFGGLLGRHIDFAGEIFYPGVIGFTGLSISGGIIIQGTSYFIGSALRVKIKNAVL